MDLTVVVVTHRSAHVVGALLDALGETAARVLAVDNDSRDGTLEHLRARGVRTVPLSRNAGFAVAANHGARLAETGHLCFLNPDCAAEPQLLEAGLAAISARPAVCAAPRLRERGAVLEGRQPGYTRQKLLCDVLETCWGGAGVWGRLRRLPGHHDESWAWAHGACLFVARDPFLALGGFDPRFFLYMEDVDFGRRWCAAGGRVEALERAVAHRGYQGAAIPELRHRVLLDRARVRYAEIHYGRAFARTLASLCAPKQLARGLLSRTA